MSEMRNQLLGKKQEALNDISKVFNRAGREGRSLTIDEESVTHNRQYDINAIDVRLEKDTEDERTNANADASMRKLMGADTRTTRNLSQSDRELDQKFRSSILNRSLEPIEIVIPANELRSGFQPGIEQRDLLTTSGSGLLGTTFHNRLVRHLVESSSILAAGATVLQTDSGETMKVPKTTALSAAGIVAEGVAIPESDPTLGSVSLGAYKYAYLTQVSYELAEDVNFDLLGFLAEQAGKAVGNGFGAHAIAGTGTGQPTGILTGATLGVTGPTGTATSFGTHTTVGMGGDLFIDLAGSLATPYARSKSAAWLMRNATLTAVRKLRDSTGNYIFDTNVIPGSGSAGTLLGRPVFTDESMPAMAAGAKSVLFGDISAYWVRQISRLRFERSNDFAFDKDLVTFRVAARLDGALVDTTGAVKYFAHSAT